MNTRIKGIFLKNFSSLQKLDESHFFNSNLKKAINEEAKSLWTDLNNAKSYQDILQTIVINLTQVSCDRILLNSMSNRFMEEHNIRTGGVTKISDEKDKFEEYLIKNLDKCISELDCSHSDEAQLVSVLKILNGRINALPPRFYIPIVPGYVEQAIKSHADFFSSFLLKGEIHPEWWVADPIVKNANLLTMVQSLDKNDKTECTEQKQSVSLRFR